MKRLLPLLLCVVASATTAPAAEMRFAAVFCDHVVLQRDLPLPVWGWGDPGESVTVEFAGQRKTAKADDAGKWRVTLDPLAASAEPRTLVARGAKPDRACQAADVLVGEVWLGSGQSNMAMTVNRAKDFEKEKAASGLPLIRMFREESGAAGEGQADAKGKWSVCSGDTVGSFSATLFFFGRHLHRELKIPVGLINSSVGGTPIESWIAADAQARLPQLKALLDEAARADAAFDEAQAKARYEKALAQWKDKATQAKKAGQTTPQKPRDPLEARRRRGGPGGLFNGKIAPLIPFALRGAVWYQGEANSHPGKGALYRYQLPLLVSDWRDRWGREMPFAWVQLPNFQRPGEGWLLVQEAQLKALRLPATGMAITIDIGDAKDIHPKNKQDVGLRLAMWALGEVYGRKDVATSGPLPAGCEVKGSQVVLSFTHADGGLVARGGELKGFEIAGEDRQWAPAQARIEGDKVVVSNPQVEKPAAVRYAWKTVPDCNLANARGLPASPFRTDDWPVPDAPLPAKEKKP